MARCWTGRNMAMYGPYSEPAVWPASSYAIQCISLHYLRWRCHISSNWLAFTRTKVNSYSYYHLSQLEYLLYLKLNVFSNLFDCYGVNPLLYCVCGILDGNKSQHRTANPWSSMLSWLYYKVKCGSINTFETWNKLQVGSNLNNSIWLCLKYFGPVISPYVFFSCSPVLIEGTVMWLVQCLWENLLNSVTWGQKETP